MVASSIHGIGPQNLCSSVSSGWLRRSGNLVRSVLIEATLRLRLGQAKWTMFSLRARRGLVHAEPLYPRTGARRALLQRLIVD